MKSLITAGEFAKLASTTKRTIHYYDEKNILKPAKVNSENYRFYHEAQILDYQRILLLSTLGVSLGEMKKYMKMKGNLSKLFDEKKDLIEKKIHLLNFNLKNLIEFQKNLKKNGTMINPEIKILPEFGVYFIEKEGPYAKIAQYCEQLWNMFEKRGKNFTTLSIFEGQEYRPKKCKMKIGVLAKKGMRIKKEFKNLVKYMDFDPGKVISYTYNGPGNQLSLFWKELEKYCAIKNIKIRKDMSDFEIYRIVNDDITRQFFEIYIPIEMNDLIIGKGKLAGKGVYANRDFKKGEIVSSYNIRPISKKEYQELPKSEKIFTHIHWGQIYLYGEPDRFVNHLKNPNTYQDLKNQCDIAKRNIRKGEMITCNANKDDV